MRILALAGAAAALALTACQPQQRPFADDRPEAETTLLQLADGGGITVRAPQGLADADSHALAETIAAGLRDAEIPASTEGANSLTRFLTTRVSTQDAAIGRVRVALDWSLADAKGGRAAKGTESAEAEAAQWNAHTPDLMQRIGRQLAEAVARSSMADSGAAPVKIAIDRPLYVRKIGGLSSRDEVVLRRSLEYRLRQAKLKIAEDPAEDALEVAGNFKLSPPAAGSQQVELSWSVLRHDGKELGTLSQANAVPAGTFDKPWGELATVIAEGAAVGVTEILTRVPVSKLADMPGG